MADNKNINKIKNILEKQSFSRHKKSKTFSSELKNKNIFVAIKSSSRDREIIEKLRPNIIFSLEENVRSDFIHQRASGLNHILCKLAEENNVIIGFSLRSILNTENKHEIFGRIMQNIKICRKFKVKTTIASFAHSPFEMRPMHDLISLFGILGLANPVLKSIENI